MSDNKRGIASFGVSESPSAFSLLCGWSAQYQMHSPEDRWRVFPVGFLYDLFLLGRVVRRLALGEGRADEDEDELCNGALRDVVVYSLIPTWVMLFLDTSRVCSFVIL